jgi:hypothetical protein
MKRRRCLPAFHPIAFRQLRPDTFALLQEKMLIILFENRIHHYETSPLFNPTDFVTGLRHTEARHHARWARPKIQPTGIDPADGLEQLE